MIFPLDIKNIFIYRLAPHRDRIRFTSDLFRLIIDRGGGIGKLTRCTEQQWFLSLNNRKDARR